MAANMPSIVRRLPFYANTTTLRIPDGPAVEIFHDQIVVWASIARGGESELPASSQRFPALIDLGYNGFFLLREDHLSQWLRTQFEEEKFPFLGSYQKYGEAIATFAGSVWLHPNVPGFRDQIGPDPPFRLDKGEIAVCSASATRFRLPLIGMGVLRKNNLRLLVNGEKKYITLRAPLKQN